MSHADGDSNALGDAKRVVDVLHSVRNALQSHTRAIERLETREGDVSTWLRAREMKVDAAIEGITQQLTTLRRENCQLRRELAGLITTRTPTEQVLVQGTQGSHYVDAHCDIRTTRRAFVAHLDDGTPRGGCPIVLPQGVLEMQQYMNENPHLSRDPTSFSPKELENAFKAVQEKNPNFELTPKELENAVNAAAVSYTHLTLPTILLV